MAVTDEVAQKTAWEAAHEIVSDQINKMLASPRWSPGTENHRGILIAEASRRAAQRIEEWHSTYRADLVQCWLRAERHDGNDPIEATVWLSTKPVVGESIEVWYEGRYSGGSSWLEVEKVIHSVYAPRVLEVWVAMEGYDLDELEKVMKAADEGERP